MNRGLPVLLGIALLLSRAHGLDVTSCGQVVPEGETGVLQTDLDCSADPPSFHVTLRNRATLALNGHSIKGSPGSEIVACNIAARCTVVGPGTLSGGFCGICAARSLTVQQVSIHDSGYGVAAGSVGALRISDVSVDNIAPEGVGISGGRIEATNVSATNCASNGIEAFRALRGFSLVASNNGGTGVRASRSYVIDGLVANNNGQTPQRDGAGLLALRRGRLSNAILTGNSYSSPFTAPVAVDIFARRAVDATNVACDHSLRFITLDEAGSPWGYCAGD